MDHAGVEDFAVYRSPGTLPEPGDKEVRLGTIVVRGTPVRFPSSQASRRQSHPILTFSRLRHPSGSSDEFHPKSHPFDFGDRGPPISARDPSRRAHAARYAADLEG